MKIRPYILLADKKTRVYEPKRMYSQSEVCGIVFSDILGEHIKVLFPRELKLYNCNTEKAGSEAIKNIKEQCGNKWFIPSIADLIATKHCRNQIDNLLSYINNSYRLSASTDRLIRHIDQRYTYWCECCNERLLGDDNYYYLNHGHVVLPITWLSEV